MSSGPFPSTVTFDPSGTDLPRAAGADGAAIREAGFAVAAPPLSRITPWVLVRASKVAP